MATETYRHRRNKPFDPDDTSFSRTGFEIVGWNGYDHRRSDTPDYSLTHQIPGFAGNVDLYACWRKLRFEVSLAAGTGGTVTGSGTYAYGDVANIKATPNAGYAFRKWSDDDVNAERSLTVTSDVSLTASFVHTYTVTLAANDSSWGTVTGGGTYASGSTVTVAASPKSGYRFMSWSDGGSSSHTITVTADVSLTANFAPSGPYDWYIQYMASPTTAWKRQLDPLPCDSKLAVDVGHYVLRGYDIRTGNDISYNSEAYPIIHAGTVFPAGIRLYYSGTDNRPDTFRFVPV